jgi:hypothetical protein
MDRRAVCSGPRSRSSSSKTPAWLIVDGQVVSFASIRVVCASAFANAGHIEWINPVTLPDWKFIIACGENNDFDQSRIALLGTADPPSSSVPGERLVYRYANSPTGSSRKCISFPRAAIDLSTGKAVRLSNPYTTHKDGDSHRTAAAGMTLTAPISSPLHEVIT